MWRNDGDRSLVSCWSVFIKLAPSPLPFLSSLKWFIMSNIRTVRSCTPALFLYERQNSVHPQTSVILDPPLVASVEVVPINTGLTLSKSLRQVTTYWLNAEQYINYSFSFEKTFYFHTS